MLTRKRFGLINDATVEKEKVLMSDKMLAELRPYLESLLDEALTYSGLLIRDKERRERLLYQLHKQFEDFVFMRMLAALSPEERKQFASLLEEGAAEEELKLFARRHIHNIPALVQQIFQDFRALYVKPEHQPG
ncbi:MAG TPA: hypothetical protein VFQ30_09680 [Ktedonobacteraceae bacterium]|nr:hypothetical protein [Ktedonobacteraceae bacterium]